MNKLELKDKLLKELKKIGEKFGLDREVTLIEPKVDADFSTNMALGNKGINPIELAKMIVKEIDKKKFSLGEVEIAGPGFINFKISDDSYVKAVNEIIKKGKNYGKGNNKGHLNIEFVSANPTGFLHVGHARNAAIGSTVANIVEFSGVNVTREYYINDAGNQINMLANSVFARYQQIFDKKFPLPEESYKGTDIVWCAKKLYKKYGDKFKNKTLKDKEAYDVFRNESVDIFMNKIKVDLKKFGVWFDIFASEKSLYQNGEKRIKEAIKALNNTYKKDGALWLRTTKHGDDKDRVLIKNDGTYTYFTPDIAYHRIKYGREGDDPVILNVWGADHSGYIKRMNCAMKDLGLNNDNLVVLCMQLVRLVKNGEEFKMSKRKGTSFYLTDFVKLVGKDAARFILLDRTYNSKLDFDIDIATKKTNDNPVILVQYANARTHSLLDKTKVNIKKLKAKKFTTEAEKKLISTLIEFPEIIQKSAEKYLTHLLTQYLIKLAKEFNSWYSNSDKIIGNDNEESLLALVKSVNIVMENGLKLLEVSAPKEM